MPSEHLPLYLPSDARRAFGTEEFTRRIAKISHWTGGSRILEMACGPGFASIFLAREFGCNVTAVDSDDKSLEQLRERVKAHSLADRVDVKQADLNHLPFSDGEFDGIVLQGRVLMPLAVAVKSLRRYLAPKGRLMLTYPVKVGRHQNKLALDFWEKKLGEPLVLPRESLQIFEQTGYEPEALETLNDSELDDYYRLIEPSIAQAQRDQPAAVKSLVEEIELHRSQGGKASVSYAMLIGRRKEPGEKPPASRNE